MKQMKFKDEQHLLWPIFKIRVTADISFGMVTSYGVGRPRGKSGLSSPELPQGFWGRLTLLINGVTGNSSSKPEHVDFDISLLILAYKLG